MPLSSLMFDFLGRLRPLINPIPELVTHGGLPSISKGSDKPANAASQSNSKMSPITKSTCVLKSVPFRDTEASLSMSGSISTPSIRSALVNWLNAARMNEPRPHVGSNTERGANPTFLIVLAVCSANCVGVWKSPNSLDRGLLGVAVEVTTTSQHCPTVQPFRSPAGTATSIAARWIWSDNQCSAGLLGSDALT